MSKTLKRLRQVGSYGFALAVYFKDPWGNLIRLKGSPDCQDPSDSQTGGEDAGGCTNGRFCRCSAVVEITHAQHFPRYERTQRKHRIYTLGSKLPFTASSVNVCTGRKTSKQVRCVSSHVRPKLRQHSVRNTAQANTVFNTVIQQ